jgi:hypothetical protein
MERLIKLLIYDQYPLWKGFSNCGMCTTSGMPTTGQWYTDLVGKNQSKKIKTLK